MIVRYNAIMLVLCASFIYISSQELPLNSYAEKISAGKVSEALEARIKSAFGSLHIASMPHVRKVSQEMLEASPAGHCDILIKYGCYYINEDFFATLSDEELRASLAYAFYFAEGKKQRENLKNKVTTIGSGISWAMYVYILLSLDMQHRHVKWQSKLISLWVPCGIISGLTALHRANMAVYDCYELDKYICQKIENKEGLIGLLKKYYACEKAKFDKNSLIQRVYQLQK